MRFYCKISINCINFSRKINFNSFVWNWNRYLKQFEIHLNHVIWLQRALLSTRYNDFKIHIFRTKLTYILLGKTLAYLREQIEKSERDGMRSLRVKSKKKSIKLYYASEIILFKNLKKGKYLSKQFLINYSRKMWKASSQRKIFFESKVLTLLSVKLEKKLFNA